MSARASAAAAGEPKAAAAPSSNPRPGIRPRKLPTFRHIGRLGESHGRPIYCIAFNTVITEFRSVFAVVGGPFASVYCLHRDGVIEPLQMYKDEDSNEELFACSWASIGEDPQPILIVGGEKGILRIINCTTRTTQVMLGHGNAVNEIKTHPVHHDLFLTASKDESIRLWSLELNMCIAIFAGDQGHRGEILSLDFHLSGRFFASSSMDYSVKVWSFDEGERARNEAHEDPKRFRRRPTIIQHPIFTSDKLHRNYVDCIRFYGDLLLSKSVHNCVLLWKPSLRERSGDAAMLTEYPVPDCDIWYMRFSLDPSQRFMAVGNTKGAVFVYHMGVYPPKRAGKLAHHKCVSAIRTVVFSPDGRTLLCGCDDGSVWRWDC